jgi:hypothetical protein
MGIAAAAAATTSSGDGIRRHRPLPSTEPVVVGDSSTETGDTEAAALRLRAMLHDDDDIAESSGTWVTWAWDVLDVFMATAVRSFTVFLVRLTAAREAWLLFIGASAVDGWGGIR